MQWSRLAKSRRPSHCCGCRCFRRCRCRTLVEAAMDKWGRLDILVNNAGTRNSWTMPILKAWIKRTLRRFMPSTPSHPTKWCARPGHISKLRGRQCGEYFIRCRSARRRVFGGLCASKGALNSMTLALARALGEDNIRVNAVCPGFVGTDWFRNALGEEMFDRIVEGQKNSTPCTAPERRMTLAARFCFSQTAPAST